MGPRVGLDMIQWVMEIFSAGLKGMGYQTEHCPPPSGEVNTLRTGLFKLLKTPFPGFLTILTL